MERMHANLGGKLKFRQQKQNNAEVSSITPEKERADDAEASVGSKNSMTPSMKDFMKRLERKDSQVSSTVKMSMKTSAMRKMKVLVQRKFFFKGNKHNRNKCG